METATIRKRLSEYIKVADEEQVRAIYTIVEKEIEFNYEWWNDDEMLSELDYRSE